METRSLFIIGILGFSAVGLANSIWFGLELKRFAERTPMLSSRLHMMRLKKVVAHQMYAALVQVVLLVAPPIIFFIGIKRDVLNPSDLFFVIVPAVLTIATAGFFRGWEKRVKTMPTDDPEIEAQRDAIVRTWHGKALPDW